MSNENTNRGKFKSKVLSNWFILHINSLFLAFIWYSYIAPNSDETFQSLNLTGRLAGTLGVFISMMFLPWLIAIISRLIRKKPSNPSIFIVYYIILFLWFIFFLLFGLAHYTSTDIDFWARLSDPKRFTLLLALLLFTLVSILIRRLALNRDYKE